MANLRIKAKRIGATATLGKDGRISVLIHDQKVELPVSERIARVLCNAIDNPAWRGRVTIEIEGPPDPFLPE